MSACDIGAAKTGGELPQSELLENVRRYLLLIADDLLDPRLQQKIAPSDLVQQTLLEAHRDFASFRGDSQRELMGWLKQILLHNLANTRREFCSQKRDIAQEQALDQEVPSADDTPSALVAHMEETQLVEQAMKRLPEAYRQVLSFRSLHRLSFAEVGVRLGRSPEAARKLWYRAMQRLKQELES